MRAYLFLALTTLLANPAPLFAQEADDYAKLGPNAVAITADNAYLRSAEAPDYWAFSSFVKPHIGLFNRHRDSGDQRDHGATGMGV